MLRVVGQSIPRVDAEEKVTGRAAFASDLRVPDMAHAAILRSPIAHARITKIDASGALALPGVLGVLTQHSLDGFTPYFGPAFRDRPVVAIDRVRFEGEPVAAAAALDEHTAREALDLIEVEYEALPSVTTIAEALAPGAPVVNALKEPSGHFRDLSALQPEPGTNICHRFRYGRGRDDAGLGDADLVVEESFTFPMVQHVTMEPHVAIGQWGDDEVTVWTATQNPYSVRSELSQSFGIPANRIRIVAPHLGAGYGAKCYAKLEPIALALSRMARRPVRVASTVADSFRTIRRCEADVTVAVGVRRDGIFAGMRCVARFNLGAYADIGPRVVQKGIYTASGPYRFPHLRLEGLAVHTNTTPGGAFRGFGVPQLAWALESVIDTAADRLGMDPVDLRAKNFLRPGDEFAEGERPIEGDFEQVLHTAADAVGWGTPPAPGSAPVGRGVATMLKASLSPTVSEAIVRLHADGTATVLSSSVEMGQGVRTTLAQICAEALVLPLERVRVAVPDTSVTPYDQTTSSSRSTVCMGLAVQRAAEDVVEQIRSFAAEQFEAPREIVQLTPEAVVVGPHRLTLPELLTRMFGMPGGELIGRGAFVSGRSDAPLGGNTPFWEHSAGAAELDVDEETGEVHLRRYVSVADVGRAINPQQCEGQDEGAAMQGLGHTLFEEMVYDGNGQLLNGTLLEYRVPTCEHLPGGFETILVENGDGPGPYGSKGAGEGGLIPVAPAVGNALARLTGARLRSLPMTPERVWRALRERRPEPPRRGS